MKKSVIFLFLVLGVFLVNFSFISALGPSYTQVSVSKTIAGQTTLFSINITDEVALEPNGQYIFSTNNTGDWINNSAVNFTTNSSWANITKTLNSTVGIIIGYMWYFNNTNGETNSSEIYNLKTTELDLTPPQVTVVSPKSGKVLSDSEVSFELITNEKSSCRYNLNSGSKNYTMEANSTYTGFSALKELSDDVYTVHYYCIDNSGNWNGSKTITFSVNTSEDEEYYEEDENVTIFRATSLQLQKGYEGFFKEKEIISVNLSNRGVYLIEIKNVNKISGNITFSFNQTNYSIPINSTLKWNFDKDNYYDFQISAISINNLVNSTRLNFKEIHEEIPKEIKNPVNQSAIEETNYPKIKDNLGLIIWTFILLVVLFLIGFIIMKISRHRRYRKYGY